MFMVTSLPRLRRHGLLLLSLAVLTLPANAQQADGLQAALQAALSQHPAVSGKRAQIEAREYSADAARSQRYPSVTARRSSIQNRAGILRPERTSPRR